MPEPEVFYSSLREDSDSPLDKLGKLLEKVNLDKFVNKDDLVAIKTHIGEEGSVRYMRPTYVRKVVDEVKSAGGNPFVTDTTAMYPGARFNGVDDLLTAAHNGFTLASMNAPVIIADGLRGWEGVDIEVPGEFLSEVNVAKAVADADKLIVVSHFKLHEFSGIGGAIKNLGMGCVTKKTKAACHQVNRPYHVAENCSVCGDCVDACEYDSVTLKDNTIIFDRSSCKGCLACYFGCNNDGYELPKGIRENLQKALADSAFGVTKMVGPENIIYINLLMDIVTFCDCAPMSGVPITADIGYLVSTDPVAVDMACVDLIEKDYESKESRAICEHGVWDKNNQLTQIEYCEGVGLGTGNYKLVTI